MLSLGGLPTDLDLTLDLTLDLDFRLTTFEAFPNGFDLLYIRMAHLLFVGNRLTTYKPGISWWLCNQRSPPPLNVMSRIWKKKETRVDEDSKHR